LTPAVTLRCGCQRSISKSKKKKELGHKAKRSNGKNRDSKINHQKQLLVLIRGSILNCSGSVAPADGFRCFDDVVTATLAQLEARVLTRDLHEGRVLGSVMSLPANAHTM
jgi:hypothetical protein